MATYAYNGPVEMYGKCICDVYKAETTAPSSSKARSNLVYRFKKENGMEPRVKISLPGKIVNLDDVKG